MTRLPAVLRVELAKLDSEQVFELLGEILEPSVETPFSDVSEELMDAMEPVSAAYAAEFKAMNASVDPDQPDDEFWAESDRRYDQARDDRAMGIAETDLTH